MSAAATDNQVSPFWLSGSADRIWGTCCKCNKYFEVTKAHDESEAEMKERIVKAMTEHCTNCK